MAAKKAKKSKKIGTRRSSLNKKKRGSKRLGMIFMWFKRLSIIIIAVSVILWSGAWFFLSKSDDRASDWIKSAAMSSSADAGFRVANILVEGRRYSDPDILLALINIEKGDPIFSFKPNEAKTQIEKIGWVKSALVERRLPDTIYVHLIEREPLALWRDGGALFLIDIDGEPITKSGLSKFKDLLMISGKGAPSKAYDFISMLDAETMLKDMVNNAKLIDNRRWDLYLHDKKLIKLPESDIGLAIKNIMLRHEQANILTSDAIAVIDARYQGRLIIRTKLGKVQDYKATNL